MCASGATMNPTTDSGLARTHLPARIKTSNCDWLGEAEPS
jgi:hypothetical protein